MLCCHFPSILFFFVLLVAPLSVYAATPQETAALNDLFAATNGTSWIRNDNWGYGDPCAFQWFGVFCQYQSVVQLNLVNNNLQGTIPNSIGNLVNLQIMKMYDNQLAGTLPNSFGNLVNLQQVSLSGNMLSGSLPSSIGNLQNIQSMFLEINQFSGSLPSSFWNLKTLSLFYINNNKLSGVIPPDVQYLYSLNALVLSSNQFSGPIPNQLSYLSLNTLLLDSNFFNGTLPQFLQQNPNIISFNVSNNYFNCPIPAWCGPPPSGNGECGTCVNIYTEPLCCAYSNNNCKSIAKYSCTPSSSNCPATPGFSQCGSFPVATCSLCTNPSDLSLARPGSSQSIKIN